MDRTLQSRVRYTIRTDISLEDVFEQFEEPSKDSEELEIDSTEPSNEVSASSQVSGSTIL
jgi:hypothetical protein